jgi:hypothetical protein
MGPEAPRPLLEIARYHRSEDDAREYVKGLATFFGVANFGTKLLSGDPISVQTNSTPQSVNLRREVLEARLTGVPRTLQFLFDQSDRLMPPAFDIAVSGNVPGLSIGSSVTMGGFSSSVQGPGIHEPPVGALAADVLFFRNQAVLDSADPDLKSLARSYRTYLQVSISLIDAFLGHATFALAAMTPRVAQSEHYEVIKSPSGMARRIDAWCRLWDHPPATYHQTKCWSDLDKLRQERNRYVHPAEPVYSIGIDEIVNMLNRCRDGVGGSLAYLRKVAGLDPRLSYIEKVLTAPVIARTKYKSARAKVRTQQERE